MIQITKIGTVFIGGVILIGTVALAGAEYNTSQVIKNLRPVVVAAPTQVPVSPTVAPTATPAATRVFTPASTTKPLTR